MGRLGDCINSEKYGPIWWCKNSKKECKLEKPEPCDDEKSSYYREVTMKVKTVSRTISFGDFENISMSSEVPENENELDVLKKIEERIRYAIEERTGIQMIVHKIDDLKRERDNLEIEVNRFINRKEELIKWAKKHNIALKVINDLPF